jgi:integrase/recombinase XerD
MIDALPDTMAGTRNKALLSMSYDFLARCSELVALQSSDLTFTKDGSLTGMIRKSKTDQYGKGRLVFGSNRSAKLVRRWLRLKPKEIKPLFCAINHGRFIDRPICDQNVNDIIKRSVVKVKGCVRPSDLEVSGHSLRVGAAQDLLIKGYDLAAIMRAGGWSDPNTVSRYLRFSQHNLWKYENVISLLKIFLYTAQHFLRSATCVIASKYPSKLPQSKRRPFNFTASTEILAACVFITSASWISPPAPGR